jgi:hypothetical protein
VRGEADALAARGLVACLEGATEEGHRRLEIAHALHRGAGDAIRRAKVVEMARLVGLELGAEPIETASPTERRALLRSAVAAHQAAGRRWREALDLFRLAELEEDTRAREDLLDSARRAADDAGVAHELSAALARSRDRVAAEAAGSSPRAWTVGPQARWLHAPDGTDHDLARHGSMRRLLDVLVERRLRSPGAATSADALFEAGWPGERARYASRLLRVYTTIRRLRALGLDRVLLTRDDGYLFDPYVAFARSDERPAVP